MKKILIAFAFGLMALGAHAEATFDQIQVLIEQHQYQAAEKGLEVIIQNHPKSAKAFYAMAQAQAGLGNQEKAQKALDLATGLNPTLDFAPASSVASLKEAITPQTKKIEAIEESHFGRNIALFGMFILFTVAMYFLYSVYARKKDQEEGCSDCGTSHGPSPTDPKPSSPNTVKDPVRETGQAYANTYTPRPAYQGTPRTVTPAPTPAPTYSAPAPTVVNNHYGSSNDGLLTGVLIGEMMSNNHHSHDTTIIREVPAPSRSSTWDDTPSYTPSPTQSVRESKSSTWDDTPAPSKSSSWDDDSSSSKSSSSSWSSSSDDSSSSSSWSDSSSSSDSGSSWD